jgi:hypothetical protein
MSDSLRTALLVLLLLEPAALAAQDDEAMEEELPRYRLGFEVRAHYRDSERARFPVPFPFTPEMLPPGQTQGFMETVEAGRHTDLSVITVHGSAQWREDLAARVKIDFIDRYDRNPTSEDREVDVDEAWLRFGREAAPAEVPERGGAYVKLGKFGKFERQDDRHLESYGLMATAFNFLEDVGVEVGLDFGRHLYAKVSYSQGNPLFFRDPNALAGDNGTSVFDPRNGVVNPVSEIKTGFPIFYDADVDEIDFEHPELGAGVGWRWSSPSGFAAFDVLAWGYTRELAAEADLHNTFYGGDLDLLLGPGNLTPLPVSGDEKQEAGANLWLYVGGFALFGQYVDQDLAGLDRTGYEVETSYVFDLPLLWAVGGRQLFPWVSLAVRYSELDPDFRLHPNYPAPSVVWDWEKIDAGVRLAVVRGLEVTVEWQDNTFVRLGRDESNDEFLVTLALSLERRWPRR